MFIANTIQSTNIILIFRKKGDNYMNIKYFFVKD